MSADRAAVAPPEGGEQPRGALLERGDGPPLLLLHGWGASKELMMPLVQCLPGVHAIVPDLPGFGATPPPPRPWEVDDYARWVIALLDRLGVGRCDVLGHSNGGRIAIALAAAQPDRVHRVVLTGSAGIRPRHGLAWHARVRTFKVLRRLSRSSRLPAAARARLEEVVARRGSDDYRSASGTMRATLVRLVNSDLRDRLTRVRAPTLLIWGEHDDQTPMADARLMERLIPDAGLVVLEGCGHFAYAEQPERFCRIVDVFIHGDPVAMP